MRTPSWCESCRKFRTVRVTVWGYMKPGAMPVGKCLDCEDERNKR